MLYTREFFTMAAANLCTVSSFSFFFLFPLFITDHGGSMADIGVVMGAFSLSSVLCRPWISEMVDRIGRKRSYALGCLIMSGLPLIYLFFKGDLSDFYLSLMAVRIVHGIGLAICFTSVFTYIADIIPDSRLNEGLGMFGVTGLTGMAVGPIIAEIILKEFGFPVYFMTASCIGILGFLLQFPLPESYIHVTDEPAPSFFAVLMRRRTFLIFILAFLFGFGLAAFGGFVSPYAKEKHLTFISLYYISYSSAAVATRLLGGRLADRVGEERIIPYALILTGTGLLTMILLGGNVIVVLAGLLSGCGHGFLFPSLNALAIRNEPIHIRGRITGIFTGGIDTGAFIGSIILGYIGEWVGYPALFCAAGLSLFAGLWVSRFQRMNNKEADPL